jgi:hypothetical protein
MITTNSNWELEITSAQHGHPDDRSDAAIILLRLTLSRLECARIAWNQLIIVISISIGNEGNYT